MSQETLQTLTWLIPAGPLLAFFLIALFTHRNRTLSWMIAWTGVIAALILGWTVAGSMSARFFENPEEVLEHPVQVASSIDWIPVGSCVVEEAGNCESWIDAGVAVDGLTAVMLFMVTFTVFMIFVYSVGYHNFGQPRGTHPGVPNHGKEDPIFSRFFAYMSLFAFGMLLLVTSDNLLFLFIGWEIMGFCSYSLIGFWYAREYHLGPDDIPHIPPYLAAKKAFMVTRIADVVMLLGIVFFYRTFGTLNFSEALSAHSLETAAAQIGVAALGVMALLLFTGTVGKSAQWPLHVWLPDAMEGPTPVSAVIHAAAMVSAGIYMLLRVFPLIAVAIEGNPGVGWVIGGIGAFTALMAATIAIAQNDVKGVLAYSTISQLGFMVATIGVGGYIAAAFHLITHGFFKALLFLASGSVIHGMEHGAMHVHDHHTDPQDMRYMGGLRKKMPVTFWTFVIGGLALSGFPFVTAGFWSKDEMFAEAFTLMQEGNLTALFVLVMLVLAAFLTAYYTARQISLTFLGKPRSPLAEHAHESNKFMTVPLVLLAVFAVSAGWSGITDNFLGSRGIFRNYFHALVGSSIEETMLELKEAHLVAHGIETLPWNWSPLILSLVVALGGLFIGWWIYGRKALPAGYTDPVKRPLGPLYNFFQNKWYWDELYHTIFYRPTVWISEQLMVFIDKGIIDGILHLIARIVYVIGHYAKRFEEIVISGGVDWLKDKTLQFANWTRQLQTGNVQEYAAVSGLIAAVFAFSIVLLINYGWLEKIQLWFQQIF
ncbi:MAG TPA: NADH-quinone oxidoreductase subunit L [Chloroflexi bacterium]|nr:NADH-quinone oxidoreductase subunit L [Chloroflexota bacterium]